MDSALFRSISCATLYGSYNGRKGQVTTRTIWHCPEEYPSFFYGTLTIGCAATSPEDGALAINIARETT